MSKVWHILGNGDKASYYNEAPREGKLLLCNMPPFEVPRKKVYATTMVDFKMMMALTEGSIALDQYDWILGTRPRIWMYEQSNFYMKYAHCVKDFYTHVPEYAGNPTNFNCGHMAVHYAAAKQGADEIHMYGFDTIFDFNMRSVTDLVLSSDRGTSNNYRLLNTWRPVWRDIFREFPKTKFVLHHNHAKLKIPLLANMEVIVYNDTLSSAQTKTDESDISDGRGMEKQPINPGVSAPMNRQQRRRLEAIEKRQRK
tara:strand:+ start:16243 stop:17007 length:765 start_codon:yes stop_codon:yes gene_type:complete